MLIINVIVVHKSLIILDVIRINNYDILHYTVYLILYWYLKITFNVVILLDVFEHIYWYIS